MVTSQTPTSDHDTKLKLRLSDRTANVPVVAGPDLPQTAQAYLWIRLSMPGEEEDSVIDFPTHLRAAKDRLLSLAELGQNWDGQGAAAVDKSTVQLAQQTLWDLVGAAAEEGHDLPAPAVAVSPEGAAGFEWSTPEAYVSVECLDDSRSAYVRVGGKETERSARSAKELWKVVRDAISLVESQSRGAV